MTVPYDHLPEDHERRVVVLTEEQIDDIAGRVEARFYQRVGKKVVEKVLWAIGLGALALIVWLGGKGLVPKP